MGKCRTILKKKRKRSFKRKLKANQEMNNQCQLGKLQMLFYADLSLLEILGNKSWAK